MRVKSNQAQAKKQIWALLGRNLTAGVDHLTDVIKEKISIQGVPMDRRSFPGEPPRKETGALYEGYHNVVFLPELTARVGSDQPYDIILEDEEGLDRPHVRGTLIEESDEMARRMTKP